MTTSGQNHIFPDGTNEWRREPDDPRQRLVAVRTESRAEVEETIERLMAQAEPRLQRGLRPRLLDSRCPRSMRSWGRPADFLARMVSSSPKMAIGSPT